MEQNYGENSGQTEQNQFDGKEQYGGDQANTDSQAVGYADDSQPVNGYQPGDTNLNNGYQSNDGSLTGAYPADNSNQQDNHSWNNSYQQDNNNWNNAYQQDNRNGNNGWQQGSGYQNSGYADNHYQNNGYQNGSYSGSSYQNGSYQNMYQPYHNIPPYQNDQLELEEPVKISEWVLALVLMMIPCVNIIMMFVWAFSSSEKKSKSNFFKAYLIFFGISMAFVLLIWILLVWFVILVG